jgi:hypothetical protein
MSNRKSRILLVLGAIALVALPLTAAATPLTAGDIDRYGDHSSENHQNQTLDNIDISHGTFAGSNLKNTSLVGGVFRRTDFSNTNLQGADFTNADLLNAIFSSGANLKNANLSGANLIGVNLTGINIQGANFTGAIYNTSSTLGFDGAAAGMIAVPELSPFTLVVMGLLILAGSKDEGLRRGLAGDRASA